MEFLQVLGQVETKNVIFVGLLGNLLLILGNLLFIAYK